METENLREIEVLLYALCGSIHACMPYGLSSTLACVICCFHCVLSQLPGALSYVWKHRSGVVFTAYVMVPGLRPSRVGMD